MHWEICKKLESTECAIELQKDIILDTIVINIKKKKKLKVICKGYIFLSVNRNFKILKNFMYQEFVQTEDILILL